MGAKGADPAAATGAAQQAAALLDAGRRAFMQGRLDEAEQAAQAALRQQPGMAGALHLIGVVTLRRGAPEAAVTPLARAAKAAPTDAVVLSHLGDALRGAGKAEDAVAAYRGALAIAPDRIDTLSGLGMAFASAGRAEEALPLLERAARLAPQHPMTQSNFGNALLAVGRAEDAAEAYAAATTLAPNYPQAHNNLASALIALGRFEEAAEAARRAIALEPGYVKARFNLGTALALAGRREDAAEALRALLELAPDDAAARHLLASVSGEAPPEAAPPEYVREIFDRQAEMFDRHLVERLQYRVPELLRTMIDAVRPPVAGEALRILDLGCGTGLCGVALKPRAGDLAGVDLSPRMVERAQARGVYDRLAVGDLHDSLAEAAGAWDLIVAGDVLIYLGSLERAFAGAARALDEGGLLAFSLELGQTAPYAVGPSGRYAHAPAYVETAADAAGLAILRQEDATVRLEAGQPVSGRLYVLAPAS